MHSKTGSMKGSDLKRRLSLNIEPPGKFLSRPLMMLLSARRVVQDQKNRRVVDHDRIPSKTRNENVIGFLDN